MQAANTALLRTPTASGALTTSAAFAQESVTIYYLEAWTFL
jgi:hypothetical protein